MDMTETSGLEPWERAGTSDDAEAGRYCTEADLTTPALVVDLDRLQRNIDLAAQVCRQAGVHLRPHIKTHKCVEIGRMQLAAGAIGISVQTAKEAEVFAQAGFTDIFLARPPIQPNDLRRLAAVAGMVRLRVAVDSLVGVQGIAVMSRQHGVTVDVRVEVDAGLGRSGVRDLATLKTLWSVVEDQPGLRFDGVFGYEGQVYAAQSQEDLVQRAQAGLERVFILARQLRELSGLDFTISMGATPSFQLLAASAKPSELRPGNYVFSDAKLIPLFGLERCAQSVLSTVIGCPAPDRCVLDCGMKSLAAELHQGAFLRRTSYGHIVEYPEASIAGLSEEHAIADLSLCAARPRIGERVHVIANHACTTTNLHERIFAVCAGQVEGVWKVAARGRWD